MRVAFLRRRENFHTVSGMKKSSHHSLRAWTPLLWSFFFCGTHGRLPAEALSPVQALVSTNLPALEIDGELEGLEKPPPPR